MIIDNFLPEDEFENIKNILFSDNFPWFFVPDISTKGLQIDNSSYMIHLLYNNDLPNSKIFHQIYESFRHRLQVNSLIRMKVNMHLNSEKFRENPMHTDYDFEHKGAVFSLNTCNGYTKLKDGTIVESIANRMFLFDSSKEHCSTNTSNKDRRVNINFNYF